MQVGNVYVMFEDEEGCAKALTALNGRFYAGRPILPEFSPVTDFHDARCRQYDEGICGTCPCLYPSSVATDSLPLVHND